MAGNVWEWVEDDGHPNYVGAPNDGSAWIDNPRPPSRIRRGLAYRAERPKSYKRLPVKGKQFS